GLPSYLASNVASLAAGATVAASTATANGTLPIQALDANPNTAWQATQAAAPSLTVQLPGTRSYRIDRVRLLGLGTTQDVKRFQVAVSITTADDASFTTVLDTSAPSSAELQEFVFPGGALDARYVKFSVLSNYGYPFTALLEFEAV